MSIIVPAISQSCTDSLSHIYIYKRHFLLCCAVALVTDLYLRVWDGLWSREEWSKSDGQDNRYVHLHLQSKATGDEGREEELIKKEGEQEERTNETAWFRIKQGKYADWTNS